MYSYFEMSICMLDNTQLFCVSLVWTTPALCLSWFQADLEAVSGFQYLRQFFYRVFINASIGEFPHSPQQSLRWTLREQHLHVGRIANPPYNYPRRMDIYRHVLAWLQNRPLLLCAVLPCFAHFH